MSNHGCFGGNISDGGISLERAPSSQVASWSMDFFRLMLLLFAKGVSMFLGMIILSIVVPLLVLCRLCGICVSD